MRYYCHPDSLTMAVACWAAQQSGHADGSLEWLRVYRDAYEREARGCYPETLTEYLEALDARIAEMSRTSPA